MKKVILTALAVVSLTACGKETVREVLVTTPEPAPTVLPAPDYDKFTSYLDDVRANAAQARSMTDDDLLKFGTLICDAFDAGKSVDDIAGVLANYSSGSYDTDLYAYIIIFSVKHLCPDYKYLVPAANT